MNQDIVIGVFSQEKHPISTSAEVNITTPDTAQAPQDSTKGIKPSQD